MSGTAAQQTKIETKSGAYRQNPESADLHSGDISDLVKDMEKISGPARLVKEADRA